MKKKSSDADGRRAGDGQEPLTLPPDRHLTALERFRKRIAEGAELEAEDCTEIGMKGTHCSWGLCSMSKDAWPDPQDHLWPDQFIANGRVAVRYLRDFCPIDRHANHVPSDTGALGCFYRCRIFSPEKGQKIPTREETLALYDVQIERVSRRS